MELIFVYNADSGLIKLMQDAAHKVLRPQTYPCSLCALTYGAVSERGDWRRFRKQSSHSMRFLHKDEFEVEFGQRFEYPVVLSRCGKDGDSLSILISSQRLNEFQDVDALIQALTMLE